MNRRQFLASTLTAATAATLPRIGTAQTPVASPVAETDVEFVPVEVNGSPLSLSPDGTMIAGVTGENEDRISIWDTQSFEPLAQSDPMDEFALLHRNSLTWAPDNSAIAFWLNTIANFIPSDIYTLEVAAGTLTNLTNEQGQAGATPAAGTNQATDDALIHTNTFPVWSPHSNRIAFCRFTLVTENDDYGTELCTVPREGGDMETIATLSEEQDYVVSSTMFWDPDGSILYGTQPYTDDPADNGIFRVLNDGTVNPVSNGQLAAGMPMPFLYDVAPAAGLASVMAAGNHGSFAVPGVYFLVDLTTGTPTPFEEILSLPTDFDTANAQGLLLDTPPSIVTGTAGAAPRFIYITTDFDAYTIYLQPMDGGDRVELATVPELDDSSVGRRMPHIDIADNGTVLAMTWTGTWIAHNAV